MALFSSVFRQLFERFAHFLCRKAMPQRAHQCAAQELAAVEKLPEDCEAFDFTGSHKKCRKRRRKVPEKYPLGERAPEDVLSLPCSPVQVDPPKLLPVPPRPDEVVSLRHSSFQKLPLAVPLQLTLAPDELFSIRCSSSQVCPPKDQMLSLVVPPRPTPAPDELFSTRCFSSQVRHPRRLPPSTTHAPDEVIALRRPPSRKPQPLISSQFEPPPQLMLIDIEDEESEYVEYTGKTTWASDLLKSERPQRPEAEMKPRKMVAWLEKDSEVQEEVWASKVVEVQGFEEEEGDPNEMGDSKAIQGHSDDASQTDELMMKLFCVTFPDGSKNETQHNVNVQKKCKRKVPLVLFTWAEEKAKKKEKKKIIQEKEQREKELLLGRYMNDPKLKHLWINKHNRNYTTPPNAPSLFTFNLCK